MVRRSFLVLAAGLLAVPLAGPALAQTKTFGGEVLEVNAKAGWFIMKGGGSKKYPKPKIIHSKATKWTGLKLPKTGLKVGDRVLATVTPKDGAFVATKIEVLDPKKAPAAAGVSAPG